MPEKVKHSIFTVIVPVKRGRQDSLRSRLHSLNYRGFVPANDVLGFDEMEMLHYASMFLYEDPVDSWLFVFEANIDGSIDAYLDSLVDVATRKKGAGKLLIDLYNHCEGYAGGDLPGVKRYMADHIQLPVAAHVAGVGLTRNRIRTDVAIHRVVDQALGNGVPQMSEKAAQSAVFQALASNDDTKDFTDISGDTGHGASTIARIIGWPVVLVIAISFFIFAILTRYRERNAEEDNLRPSTSLVQAQKEYEDLTPTNHMASIVHVHRDSLRKGAKRAAFLLLSGLVKMLYQAGRLGKIESIHFAHWAFVNNGRRLLFVSNYDGSWDSYLDDFTLKASTGLTLAWAHDVGFPRSKYMLFDGAAKGPEFIDWARRSMVPCPVWYNAYPGVSVNHIVRNRKLRHALSAAKAGRVGTQWLKHV